MATFSSGKANYGLTIYGALSKTNVSTGNTVGVATTELSLPTAAKGYCVSATLSTAGDSFLLTPETGVASTSDAPAAQVETATASGGITLDGDAIATVTGALIAGSPLVVPVAVLNGDTNPGWIAKVRTELGAVPAITEQYTVGGSGLNITLTKNAPFTNNDPTLSVDLANGTCAGIFDASSSNTTAGVAGVIFTNNTGDGKDFEGVSIGALGDHLGILVQVVSGAVTLDDGTSVTSPLAAGTILLIAGTSIPFGDPITVTSTIDDSEVNITIVGA
jgi:hypothetical protein